MTSSDGNKSPSLLGTWATIIDNLFGSASHNVGEGLDFLTSGFKRKNLEKLAELVRNRTETSVSIVEVEVPDGFKVVALEAASTEEFDEVLNLWAELIAAARTGKLSSDYRPFVETLRFFTPTMALVFEVLAKQNYKDGWNGVEVELNPAHFEASEQLSALDDVEIIRALATLQKEGLITRVDREFRPRVRNLRNLNNEELARSIQSISNVINHLASATHVEFRDSISRQIVGEKEVALLNVNITDFGRELAKVTIQGALTP